MTLTDIKREMTCEMKDSHGDMCVTLKPKYWWVRWAMLAAILAVMVSIGWHREQMYQREHALVDEMVACLDQSKAAVIVTDDHGIVVRWSNGAERLFGLTREQAIGFGLSSIIPPEMREAHRSAFDEAVLRGDLKAKQVRIFDCPALNAETGERFASVITLRTYVWRDGTRRFWASVDRAADVERLEVTATK